MSKLAVALAFVAPSASIIYGEAENGPIKSGRAAGAANQDRATAEWAPARIFVVGSRPAAVGSKGGPVAARAFLKELEFWVIFIVNSARGAVR